MADDKTIEEYKLKEGDFIVVMVAKAKPVKEKKPEATPAPVPQSSGTAVGGSMPSSIPSQPLVGSSAANVPSPVPNPGSSADSHPEGGAGGVIPSGEQLESILVEMESMGFPRDE
jgi:UV excision repair protein RAD23